MLQVGLALGRQAHAARCAVDQLNAQARFHLRQPLLTAGVVAFSSRAVARSCRNAPAGLKSPSPRGDKGVLIVSLKLTIG